MKRRLLVVLLVVLVVVPVGAIATVQGQPDLSVYLPGNEVSPGEETTVSVQIMNTGTLDNGADTAAGASDEQRVMTARGVQATMKDGDVPLDVNTGTLALGSITDGAVRTANFDVSVSDDAAPGTYRVPVEVSYEYTDMIANSPSISSEDEVTKTFYVTLKIERDPQFAVVSTSTDAPVGGTGTIALTLQNVGSEAASNARVSVRSLDRDVTVGGSGSASRFVGEWASGENWTIEVSGSVAATAETRRYPLQTTVSYEDTDGQTESSEALTAGITPAPEQSFSLSNVESTLRVGEEGSLALTVSNDGPEVARDAVLRISSSGQNVHPQETEYALGTFGVDESVDISFPIEVSENAEAGSRQLTYTLTYLNGEGEQRQSDPLNVKAAVAAERDQFTVETVANTISAGGSDTLTLEITNNGGDTVRNVNAKVFADDPLSAGDDEAFVQQLEPGESTQITFSVAAGGSALAKTYPLSMDFQYDVDGESKLTKTYQVPVDVTESQGGGLPAPAAIGVFVVIVVAAGGYWYTQRR